MNKLIEYHIKRLEDKSTEVRLKAIQELRLIGSAVALSALERVFRTDEDPAVRRAAQEAGREIYLKNQEARQG
ncbi:MAG: hypothetical protein OHK0023_23160 [Anaerolineae bacterium]